MHLLCFGFGYCARHLARSLAADGGSVEGTTRTERTDPNAVLHRFDAVPAETIARATHLLVSVPPGPDGDPALQRHREALLGARNLRWIGYLSTTGVYGDSGGAWVDEDTVPQPVTDGGRARLAAEQAWTALGAELGVPVRLFRLGGIYGPGGGRNALDRVRDGTARRVVKPGMVFNRISVDDIVATLRASMDRPGDAPVRVYDVVDGHPLPPEDAIVHAAALLGVEPPPEVAFDDPSVPPFVRSFYVGCVRVRGERLRSELGVVLRYRDVLAGLDAIARDAGLVPG